MTTIKEEDISRLKISLFFKINSNSAQKNRKSFIILTNGMQRKS